MGDIVMPRLSDTMEEGTILRWLRQDGDHVARGEDLVEIETDKATMSYTSDQDGVLRTIAREGDTLAVGERIAFVGAEGEEMEGAEGAGQRGGETGDVPADDGEETDASQQEQAQPAVSQQEPGQQGASQREQAQPAAQPEQAQPPPSQDGGATPRRVRASPLARRLARERGVELRSLTGTGPAGRIVKADVQAAIGGGAGSRAEPAPSQARADSVAAAPSDAATAPPSDAGGAPSQVPDVSTLKGATTTIELSRMQRAIARRMAESKATIPDFSLQMSVDMEECAKLRAQLKEIFERSRGSDGADGPSAQAPAPTFNDMVVKACALALREHPRVNASYRDGELRLHERINIGVAVATDEGLVVPTVFDAEQKSLGEIAQQARTLAQRVRDVTITPPELAGGTFTVSNLGMYGVERFAAIINPPQVAILAVGSVQPRVVVRDEQALTRRTTTLTLVCDHRALYGADAARFLARVAELLETPTALTL